MSTSDTLYQVRQRSIELIERGRDNVLRAEVVRGGSPAVPSAGTVTVYDESNAVVVGPVAATIGTTYATYTLLAATTATKALGMGWRVEWSVTMLDGTTRTIVVSAALCRARLLPPASVRDLFDRVTSLDPGLGSPITGKQAPDYDRWLDTAWLQIENKLLAKGRRPWLVTSAYAFREVHILGTLALVFADLAGRNPAFATDAREYRAQYEREWAEITFEYAPADDGVPLGGATPTRQGAQTSVWLSTAGSPRTWR